MRCETRLRRTRFIITARWTVTLVPIVRGLIRRPLLEGSKPLPTPGIHESLGGSEISRSRAYSSLHCLGRSQSPLHPHHRKYLQIPFSYCCRRSKAFLSLKYRLSLVVNVATYSSLHVTVVMHLYVLFFQCILVFHYTKHHARQGTWDRSTPSRNQLMRTQKESSLDVETSNQLFCPIFPSLS